MRGLSSAEMLEVWERGLVQGRAMRALSLLAAACPEKTFNQIAAFSIGQRDALLLALREALFGPQLEAVVDCPGCNERLELSFSTPELLSGSGERQPAGEVSLKVADYSLRLRLLNTEDVLLAEKHASPEDRRDELVRRCLLSAECGRIPVDAERLSADATAAVAEKLAEADPLADIRMNISCSFCGHAWRQVFDIVEFLWTEIEAWAGRTLNEVHVLAGAYGWGEKDILALSPLRRQFYLDMVGA